MWGKKTKSEQKEIPSWQTTTVATTATRLAAATPAPASSSSATAAAASRSTGPATATTTAVTTATRLTPTAPTRVRGDHKKRLHALTEKHFPVARFFPGCSDTVTGCCKHQISNLQFDDRRHLAVLDFSHQCEWRQLCESAPSASCQNIRPLCAGGCFVRPV